MLLRYQRLSVYPSEGNLLQSFQLFILVSTEAHLDEHWDLRFQVLSVQLFSGTGVKSALLSPTQMDQSKGLMKQRMNKALACEHAPMGRARWQHREVGDGAWLKRKSKECCGTRFNKNLFMMSVSSWVWVCVWMLFILARVWTVQVCRWASVSRSHPCNLNSQLSASVLHFPVPCIRVFVSLCCRYAVCGCSRLAQSCFTVCQLASVIFLGDKARSCLYLLVSGSRLWVCAKVWLWVI